VHIKHKASSPLFVDIGVVAVAVAVAVVAKTWCSNCSQCNWQPLQLLPQMKVHAIARQSQFNKYSKQTATVNCNSIENEDEWRHCLHIPH